MTRISSSDVVQERMGAMASDGVKSGEEVPEIVQFKSVVLRMLGACSIFYMHHESRRLAP